MPGYLAFALSAGVLAMIATALFVGPLASFIPGLLWVALIAWGCQAHSGPGMTGALKALAGMAFGVLVGWIAMSGAISLSRDIGSLAAAVGIGLSAVVIALASAVVPAITASSAFNGLAVIVGSILLAELSPAGAVIPVMVAIVIGIISGVAAQGVAAALSNEVPPALKGKKEMNDEGVSGSGTTPSP